MQRLKHRLHRLARQPPRLSNFSYESVVREDGPHPLAELERSRQGTGVVVLAGRATRVP